MFNNSRYLLAATCFVTAAAFAASNPRIEATYGKLPLQFEENRGQSSEPVRFFTRSHGFSVFLTDEGMTIAGQNDSRSIRIEGAHQNTTFTGEERQPGISNYYRGSHAITAVPHFNRVRARAVLPGIDLVYHASDANQPEVDFELSPHADPLSIRLHFSETPALDTNGDLISGPLRQHKPRAWQGSREIACRYVLSREGVATFALGPYDRNRPLTIDPILSYSTFLAGSNDDYATSIAVDAFGYAYVAGSTTSTDFPVPSGSFHGANNISGNYDVFVTRLNPSGSAVAYSTYIGGGSSDFGNAIAVDGSGNAYIAGVTASGDFPTTGSAFSNSLVQPFILKLNSAGAIVYSTPVDGNGNALGIAVDSTGAAYVTGAISTANLATANAYQRTMKGGFTDAFVLKVTPSGATSYFTYLGGVYDDIGTGIAVDPKTGNAYVAGYTNSADYPVSTGAIAPTSSTGQHAFVTALTADGGNVLYSTYFGGSGGNEFAYGIALDSSLNCYITGTTQSSSFPTTMGALFPQITSYNYDIGFAVKVNPSGSAFVYSTYLLSMSPAALAVDSNGDAFITGSSTGVSFPFTPGALKTSSSTPEADIFLVEISPAGDVETYGTLLGFTGQNSAAGIALDGRGGVYLAGKTSASNARVTFPVTASAFQAISPVKAQFYDNSAIVAKIDTSSPSLCTAVVSPTSVNLPGRGGSVSFTLTLPSGCPWQGSLNSGPSSSLTLTGSGLTGVSTGVPTPFTATVSVNNSLNSSQTLTATFGNATFTVNQAMGSCTDPVIAPTSLNYDASGGIRSLLVALPAGCSWTTVSNSPWLTIITGAGELGAGAVTVNGAANPFGQRSGSITLAGISIPVTQTGTGACIANASSTSTSFGALGGSGTAHITVTGSSCGWNAYAVVPWIEVLPPGTAGQSSGSIPFLVSSNPGSGARTGQILIADQVLMISQAAGPAGVITYSQPELFAGGGSGALGDGGPAITATINGAGDVAFDPVLGRLYIVDVINSRIRVVTPDGNINTFALASGTGNVAVGPTGQLLLALVSQVYYANGGVIAGTGSFGNAGDGGLATSATLGSQLSVAADATGRIYIADFDNSRVRVVNSGTITAFAGGGTALGDNGPATSANLRPFAIAVAGSGAVYVADYTNSRIRKITPGNSAVITTIAGGGASYLDGIPATDAIMSPRYIAASPDGSVFFIDPMSGRIRRIGSDGIISTVGAVNCCFSGIAVDPAANVYYSYGNSVFKIASSGSFCSYTVSSPSTQAASGGPLSLSVTAAAGCSWTANSDLPWITVSSGAAGSGNGTITLALNPNNGGSVRAGKIYVAGQPVTIVQNYSKVSTRDLRGSGVSDMVVYDPINGTEYSALSNSDGTFTYSSHYFTPGYDVLRFGDFNGDGKADLVVYNSSTAAAYIGLGDGTGNFNFQSLFWSAGYTKVVTGDFNGDGRTDFILYSASTGTMYAALSNGNGTFTYHYNLISPNYTQVLAGDFNGDGNADLLLYRASDGLAWIGLSNGNGTFRFSPVSLPAGFDMAQAGDLNGDGLPDVLFYSSVSGLTEVGLTNPDGVSFNTDTYHLSAGFTTVRLCDFNADGFSDLIAYNKNTGAAYLGISGGLFGFAFYSLFWSPGYDSIAVLDLNGDHKSDVILYNSTNGNSYTGLSTGVPTNPFTYTYAFWGLGRRFAE